MELASPSIAEGVGACAASGASELVVHPYFLGPGNHTRNDVPQLVAAIRTFIDGWNDRCHPFTWTKTADEILPHATRQRYSDAGH